MRKHHLYAVKLSINETLFSRPLRETKTHFFNAITTSGIFLKKYNSLWNFIDITKDTIDGRNIIAGRILRGKDEGTNVVDITDVKIKRNNVKNVASWSNFIFDFATEIIIFEERAGKISKNQFIEVFKQMVEINAPELGELKYEFLPAAENLKDELRKLKVINYARFQLIPANWDDDDDFNELDQELKNLGASEATHEYKAKGTGLNPESRLIKKPVNMSLAGYGHFDVRGTDHDGVNRQVISKQELLFESVQSGDDIIEDFTRNYLSFLRKAIDQHLGASEHE
ncbi:DUF4747 family protein [Paenibacillus ehimensis]|uniref:DUF4747 family protein n=1 Tax=Paenibacillus ehimensis TaxID=79264 RepID=A0ABT8V9L8_9BACL|nr:DUF4747 family protein [Paenibacillus ehimensis]MDO3677552.1 DUF4747 family protein [Paenibacillus ehimensis]MEC0208829.1 DUF4747 family protein [Paenibacillus ehimensis]